MNPKILNQFENYPTTRYMGSKQKLVPFIYAIVSKLKGEKVLDAFGGSGTVSYLFKSMGKHVHSNDFLKYSYITSLATIENYKVTLNQKDIDELLMKNSKRKSFISKTFRGLYFTCEENVFLDNTYANIELIKNKYKKALALSALARACIKKRPRGLFTYTGMRYDDGRKDLRMSLKDQFLEAIKQLNSSVFDNYRNNKSYNKDIFELKTQNYDIVYMDPPYCSLSSDNDYSRRYHFVEGLMSYWNHVKVNGETKTKKFNRITSLFDTKKTVFEAFDKLFHKFRKSTLVVSYSSNSIPNKKEMISLMKKYKRKVVVHEFDYKYSFGTQKKGLTNNKVKEYIFVGTD